MLKQSKKNLSMIPIDKRVKLGNKFTVMLERYMPKSKLAKRRYTIEVRANENKEYRFYSIIGSPGVCKISFEEVK